MWQYIFNIALKMARLMCKCYGNSHVAVVILSLRNYLEGVTCISEHVEWDRS